MKVCDSELENEMCCAIKFFNRLSRKGPERVISIKSHFNQSHFSQNQFKVKYFVEAMIFR